MFTSNDRRGKKFLVLNKNFFILFANMDISEQFEFIKKSVSIFCRSIQLAYNLF